MTILTHFDKLIKEEMQGAIPKTISYESAVELEGLELLHESHQSLLSFESDDENLFDESGDWHGEGEEDSLVLARYRIGADVDDIDIDDEDSLVLAKSRLGSKLISCQRLERKNGNEDQILPNNACRIDQCGHNGRVVRLQREDKSSNNSDSARTYKKRERVAKARYSHRAIPILPANLLRAVSC